MDRLGTIKSEIGAPRLSAVLRGPLTGEQERWFCSPLSCSEGPGHLVMRLMLITADECDNG